MVKRYQANKVFKKYNHKCELAEELDYVLSLVPDNNCMARVKRFYLRHVTINPLHPTTKQRFTSQMVVTENMKQHLKNPSIIHPYSNFRLCWDFVMIFAVLAMATIHPFQTSSFMFQNVIYKQVFSPYYSFTMCAVFGLNIIIEFRTGYWDKKAGQVVFKGCKVAMHYLITYFLVDFLLMLPVFYNGSYKKSYINSLYIGLLALKIVGIARIFKMMGNLMMFLEMFQVGYAIRRAVQMVLTTLVYLHWHACYNIFLINLETGDMGRKIQARDWLLMEGEGVRFNEVTLWAHTVFACSLVLVMAGTARTNELREQYLIEILFWFFSRIIMIYLITNMMLAFKSKRMSQSKNTEMFWHLEVYMRSKGMPDHLRNRLLGYYEFRYQKSFFRESEIMKRVSGQLKQDMIMHNCRTLVENVSFFKKMPMNFLARIIICMTEEVYLTNDVILKVNTTPRCMYFIASGTVAIYTALGEEVCHLTEGEHFGEIGLVIPNMKRTASVIAVEICELFMLDSSDFMKAVAPFPDLLAQVEAIARSRLESTRIIEEREEQHSD